MTAADEISAISTTTSTKATVPESKNISPGDESSIPMDKGETSPSSGTASGPFIALKNPPPSAPKLVVSPPDGGMHDSTTTAAVHDDDGRMAGDADDLEGTGGSGGRNSDHGTHKRTGIVGMVARALWQYPMVWSFAAVYVTTHLVEWFYGIEIVTIFNNSIGNVDEETAQQLQEEQLDDLLRQLNG